MGAAISYQYPLHTCQELKLQLKIATNTISFKYIYILTRDHVVHGGKSDTMTEDWTLQATPSQQGIFLQS